jgi:hypothetical protein
MNTHPARNVVSMTTAIFPRVTTGRGKMPSTCVLPDRLRRCRKTIHAANEIHATPETTNVMIDAALFQANAVEPPCCKPKTRRTLATSESTAPNQSTCFNFSLWESLALSSGQLRSSKIIEATPNGALSQKIQRHVEVRVMTPPLQKIKSQRKSVRR